MADKLLLDINVCLDFLIDRKPYSNASGQLFELGEKGKTELVVSGLSFDTLFYLMRPSMGAANATNLLRTFQKHIKIGTVDSTVVKKALNANWKDLEDALHYYCALQSGCNFLITRNKKDFNVSENKLTVLTPEEYLADDP